MYTLLIAHMILQSVMSIRQKYNMEGMTCLQFLPSAVDLVCKCKHFQTRLCLAEEVESIGRKRVERQLTYIRFYCISIFASSLCHNNSLDLK